MSAKALAPGALILVTGANGYIGSHVVVQLLEQGYKVRGTVRNSSKLEIVQEILNNRNLSNDFQGVVVKDMAADGAFDGITDDCAGIIHVASDLSYNPDPNQVIPVVERGVHNALEAAARTPTVKRFVLTSSSTAAIHSTPNVKFNVTEESWNEVDVNTAWAPPQYDFSRAGAVYSASKVQGERAAWKFMQDRKPSFIFNTVLPSVNLGLVLSSKQSGSFAGFVNGLKAGDQMSTTMVRDMMPPTYMVNVEDTARLHCAALLEDDVRGERLFAFAEPINYSTIVAVLKKVDPSKTDYPAPPENEGRDLSTIPTGRAIELLKESRSSWIYRIGRESESAVCLRKGQCRKS